MSEVNADLLLVHAAAARAGHSGPARNDAGLGRRALPDRPGDLARGAPARLAGERRAAERMHPVFEAEVAEGLAAAYAAREALGLEAETVARIRSQLAQRHGEPGLALAVGGDEPAQLARVVFAADATVNGAGGLGRTSGRQLDAFHRRCRGHGGRPGNFGRGLRFHYQPARWAHAKMNFDSPEYANIVLGFARVYGQARAAGMRPRPACRCCATGCGAC